MLNDRENLNKKKLSSSDMLLILDYLDYENIIGKHNRIIEYKIEKKKHRNLIEHFLKPEFILLNYGIASADGNYTYGSKAKVLSIEEKYGNGLLFLKLRIIDEGYIKKARPLALSIGFFKEAKEVGFYKREKAVKKLITTIHGLQQYHLPVLPLFKPDLFQETLEQYARRLSFSIIHSVSSIKDINLTKFLYNNCLFKLETAKSLLCQYLDRKVKEDETILGVKEALNNEELPLLFKPSRSNDAIFCFSPSSKNYLCINKVVTRQIITYSKNIKSRDSYVLCLPEFDTKDSEAFNKNHVGILAHFNVIKMSSNGWQGIIDVISTKKVIIFGIRHVVKPNSGYAENTDIFWATYQEVKYTLPNTDLVPQLISKSVNHLRNIRNLEEFKIDIPLFDIKLSYNFKYVLNIIDQLIYLAKRYSCEENFKKYARCSYTDLLHNLLGISNLQESASALEALLSNMFKDKLKLAKANKQNKIKTEALVIKLVEKVPEGYYPILFGQDLRNSLSLNASWCKDYVYRNFTTTYIEQNFYNNNQATIIISGQGSKDYLPDSKIPAVQGEVSSMINSAEFNYVAINLIPQKRVFVTDIIVKEEVYYGKPEEIIESTCNSKKELEELKELTDRVISYTCQYNILRMDDIKNVLNYSLSGVNLETYAANLSYYLAEVLLWDEYNFSSCSKSDKELFYSKSTIEKLNYLIEHIESIISACHPLPVTLENIPVFVEDSISEPQVPDTLSVKADIKNIKMAIEVKDEKLTAASPIEQLLAKIKLLPEGSVAKSKAEQEFDNLTICSTGSSDHFSIWNYLIQLLNMPWHKTDDSIVDLRQSQKILAGSHCGLEKVKERIIEYLAVVQQAGIINSPVLCLLGAPGVGKTSLVKTIAMALGRKFVHLSLAGVDDSSYIKGHMRTYTGATPGMIVQLMQQADAKNPVILLDEIDKTGTRRGAKDVEYALLELLDPKLNEHFTDHCLQVPFDLSQVMFVTTANNIDDICPPLRDRLEVINIDSYTLTEKLKIAKTHLIPKIISSYKMDKGKIEFTDEAIQEIINFYTLEAGVRNLERSIETILRKILKSLLINSNRSAKVTTKNLPKYLGAPIFNNMIETRGYAGKVLGLSVGTYGGNILSIEAVKSQGVGKIQYTGNLGDILKESVETAYSCFRSQAPALGIKAKEYENHNIHVHLTSAATPKEGPSAGAAIYLAIISAVTQRKIRAALAVTGELGLTGQVMKVGGLKEKLIAAQRFKLDTVFIPEENLPDLNEIPKEVIQDLKIIEVNHISQILENAFETEA